MDQNDFKVESSSSMQSLIKSNKVLKVVTIVLTLAVVVSLAFGIYGTLRSYTKEEQVSELKAQVEDANGKIAELNDKISRNETNVEVTDSSNSTMGGPYIKDDYFYVPDWKLKFKIPDDLAGLGFAVDYDEAHIGYDLPFIGFTAVLKSDLIENPQDQYYDSILSCAIIEVNKTKKGKNNYTIVGDSKEIGDYVLNISDYSSSFCDFNRNTDQVYDKLKVMFQNPEEV